MTTEKKTEQDASAVETTPEVIAWNPDDWTFGDLEDFEQITGLTLEEALRPAPARDGSGEIIKNPDDKNRPVQALRLSAKMLVAIVFIEKRHANPDYTLDDAKREKVGSLSLAGDPADAGEASAATDA